MADYEIKDSGKREEFAGGSVRDTQDGKPRYELIPAEPLKRLAIHYANGAKKYGDFNWTKGQDIRRTLASMLRHSQCVLAGLEDEDHLAAVSWNAFAIMWTREQIKAGLLPESLENVLTDQQFLGFYGRARGAEVSDHCTIPCVECAHESTECPYTTVPTPAVEQNIVDDMASDGERSVIKILLEMRTRGVISESDYLLAVDDVRHCYSSGSMYIHDLEQIDLSGWVTWTDTTQGHKFWETLNNKFNEMRGGE